MILWIIIGIILIITGAVVIISSPDETPIQTPTPAPTPAPPSPPPPPPPPPVAPSITYIGPTWQNSPRILPHPYNPWSNQDPNVPLYEIYYYYNYSLPFRLSFPAGTTKVKVTPSGNGAQNFSVVEFKPAVNETTRDVSIEYTASTPTAGYVLFQLLLNNNTNPSASSNRWYINYTQ